MIELSESNTQSRYPEYLIDEYRRFLDQQNLDNSSNPFVIGLKDKTLTEDEKKRLQRIERMILSLRVNKGFGYMSSSSNHNSEKEKKTTLFISNCFQEKTNPAQPLVVTIDEFYEFIPRKCSLVMKVVIFNDVATDQDPDQQFAIILTDFSNSKIFKQEILEQVPTQKNAGLRLDKETSFGKTLLKFARNQLPLLIEEENGNLVAVLERIIKITGREEKDVNLLLVTWLLLQDIQAWQTLWYENAKKGTPLYIVAPKSFHNAMNRLNLFSEHWWVDYSYRAWNSLGNEEQPLLEDDIDEFNYNEQGISSEEFQKRIEPILNKIR